MIKNQNSHIQIENNEISGPECSNENNSGDTEPKKTSVIAHFMSKILPDDDMAGINSLNSKQSLQYGSYMG